MKTTTTGRVMVIAAHPDDEVLGCGATVHKLVSRGWVAHLVIMSAGVSGRHLLNETPTDDVQRDQAVLSAQTQRAASVIGYQGVDTFDFPDNRMDTVGRMDLVHAIRPIIEREKPDLVLTHHPGDYNWDHTVTFDAVMMAARCNPPEFSPSEIRTFEVLSSTERAWQEPSRIFAPNLYVDIGRNIDAKKLAMTYYEAEYRPYPHPRNIESIEYLARRRGNEVGLIYAEAFHTVRKVEF
jgi:LmbE family N-acetylglucosaminyl deacetylase